CVLVVCPATMQVCACGVSCHHAGDCLSFHSFPFAISDFLSSGSLVCLSEFLPPLLPSFSLPAHQQRYLASMEGAVLSGKQCAEQIATRGAGRKPLTGISVQDFLQRQPEMATVSLAAALGVAATAAALLAASTAATALPL
ncbi:unnamed protein product, partial [Closterium sp. Naga37s-1]